MRLPMLQQTLWGITFSGEVVLCCILVAKGRWRRYPAFTLLMSYHIVAEAITFLAYRYISGSAIGTVYWVYVAGDFLLQLAVVIELARIVLRPTGTWVRDAKTNFIAWGTCGCLVAFVCAWMVTPPIVTPGASFELRGNLFTSLLILELFVAMSMASNRLGLGWKNHVMAIAQGLTFCAVISSIVDALHNYLGEIRGYGDVDNIRSAAYAFALCYWIAQLWRPEPERQPLSPELKKYIADLHDRVRFDLNEVN